MKYKKTLLPVVLATLLSAGCESGNHVMNNSNSKHQSSTQKGKDKMPTQSPMLNEIFSIKQKEVPRGKSINVNYIVTKYIPIGTSRKETKQILDKMNQKYKEEGNIIHAGYFKQTHPFVPTPGVQITLQFNQSDFLENIESHFNYSE